jgi:GR25 family glycosyltransferase involved in LPS biosynthesis
MRAYDKIDRIYCISLTTTPDKLANAKKLFMKLGFEHKVRYHIVERHPLGGNVGCLVSHTEIIKECYADPNCKSVLIFEDDVILGKFYHEKHMNKIGYFIDNNKDWDILKLGHSVHPIMTPEFVFAKKHIMFQKYPSVLTHAYIVSRRGMKKHIDKFNQINLNNWDIRNKGSNEYYHIKYNFDVSFHYSMKTYNMFPIQFWQNFQDSSINHGPLQAVGTYVQNLNEYVFAEHLKAKIVITASITVTLILFCFLIYLVILIVYQTFQKLKLIS